MQSIHTQSAVLYRFYFSKSNQLLLQLPRRSYQLSIELLNNHYNLFVFIFVYIKTYFGL